METNAFEEPDVVADDPSVAGWFLEAKGWTKTYEETMGKSVDGENSDPPQEPLEFYNFAKACVAPINWLDSTAEEDGGYRIYLSDSSRTRRDVLIHIFKALLGDIFSYSVVNQVFESLGVKSDSRYLLRVRK